MPDWTAPFHRPELTTSEFEEKRAKHVAEHGYTITVPGLDDIIHLKREKPITPEEADAWKRQAYDEIPPERRQEIGEMKQKRKERYLSMLSSPSPPIVRNAGSILTTIDDAQDALTTLSVIGRLAIKFAPRMLGKAFLGPVGWIMTAADILNLVMAISRLGLQAKPGKRAGDVVTDNNPFSKKAQVRRAKRMARTLPNAGEAIEILQTTDNVFGVGLCLGPIVGFVQDAAFGAIKYMSGEEVHINSELQQFPHWTQTAQKNMKSFTHMIGSGFRMSDDDEFAMLAAAMLSQQECLTAQKDYNPLDHIADIQDTQIQAPIPSNPLTLEVIEEEGIPMSDIVGWPHDDNLWTPTTEIVNNYQSVGTSYVHDYMTRHNHDWYGHAGGSLLSMIAEHSIANLEGEEAIKYDYTAKSKWAHIMLDNGIYPDPNQPEEKLRMMESLLEYYEREGIKPTYKDMIRHMNNYEITYLSI